MKGDVRTECAVIIRRFEPRDFPAVLEIDRGAGGKHEPYLFTHFYENYPTTFMVAEVGGQLAGLIMGFKQSPSMAGSFGLRFGQVLREEASAGGS